MYRIIPTERFNADVKYYVKKKRYVHIGEDIKKVTDELQNGNFIGDEIPGLKVESDGHTYKVRSANSDMKTGGVQWISNYLLCYTRGWGGIFAYDLFKEG